MYLPVQLGMLSEDIDTETLDINYKTWCIVNTE